MFTVTQNSEFSTAVAAARARSGSLPVNFGELVVLSVGSVDLAAGSDVRLAVDSIRLPPLHVTVMFAENKVKVN